MNIQSQSRRAIDRYNQALETLRPETIGDLLALCADDVRFADPFNDVKGRAAVQRVYEDMFEKVRDLKFSVLDCHGADRIYMTRWRLDADMGRLGHNVVEGTSHITLDADGLVASHVDYWDAARLYERIPVLGAILGTIRRRISAGAG